MIEQVLERIALALEKLASPIVLSSVAESEKPKQPRKRRTPTETAEEDQVIPPTTADNLTAPLTPTGITTAVSDIFVVDEEPPAPVITAKTVQEYAQKTVQALEKLPGDYQQRFIAFIQNDVCSNYCLNNERKLSKIVPEKAGAALSAVKLWVKNNVSTAAQLGLL